MTGGYEKQLSKSGESVQDERGYRSNYAHINEGRSEFLAEREELKTKKIKMERMRGGKEMGGGLKSNRAGARLRACKYRRRCGPK